MDCTYEVVRGYKGDQAKRALIELLRLCGSY